MVVWKTFFVQVSRKCPPSDVIAKKVSTSENLLQVWIYVGMLYELRFKRCAVSNGAELLSQISYEISNVAKPSS